MLTPRRDLRALFTVDRGSEPLAYRPLPAVGMRICVVLALVLATATVANGNLAVPFPFGSPQAPQPVNVPPFASSIRLLSRLHSVVHDTSQFSVMSAASHAYSGRIGHAPDRERILKLTDNIFYKRA